MHHRLFAKLRRLALQPYKTKSITQATFRHLGFVSLWTNRQNEYYRWRTRAAWTDSVSSIPTDVLWHRRHFRLLFSNPTVNSNRSAMKLASFCRFQMKPWKFRCTERKRHTLTYSVHTLIHRSRNIRPEFGTCLSLCQRDGDKGLAPARLSHWLFQCCWLLSFSLLLVRIGPLGSHENLEWRRKDMCYFSFRWTKGGK